MDWAVMQAEHREWVDREYPNQTPDIPAAGLVEEAGELVHAVLKSVQRVVWGEDGRHGDLRAKLIDAVGDVAVYAVSFCNAAGWGAGEVLGTTQYYRHDETTTPLQQACSVVEAAAMFARGPYNRGRLFQTVVRTRHVAAMLDLNFDGCVASTWAKVRTRVRAPQRPKVVCLCGSTRFKRAWHDETKRLTHEGVIVLGVGDLDPNHPNTNVPIDIELKRRLDELHLRKIDMADEVFVLNEKHAWCFNHERWTDATCPDMEYCCVNVEMRPYIGESTRREIAYAESTGKPVRYLR